MTGETLTGRRRHRLHKKPWRRAVLILQVEAEALVTYCVGGHIDSEWRTYWRDARTEDLSVHEAGLAC